MLGEYREVAVGVVNACMVMVGHRGGECDVDIRAFGGQAEAVDECVVGVLVGAQKEASLGTAAGDHLVTTRYDLARECHARVLGPADKKLRLKVPSDGNRGSNRESTLGRESRAGGLPDGNRRTLGRESTRTGIENRGKYPRTGGGLESTLGRESGIGGRTLGREEAGTGIGGIRREGSRTGIDVPSDRNRGRTLGRESKS